MNLLICTKYEFSNEPIKEGLFEWLESLSKRHRLLFGPQSVHSMNALRKTSIPLDNAIGPVAKMAAMSDAVISIGGDGTMLGVAREVAGLAIGMVGINLGHIGFITDLEWSPNIDWELEQILNGQRDTEDRMLLETMKQRSLNDIMLQRKSSKMIEVNVLVNHRFAYRVRCDGLLFSTPTGSTAYHLAAGGPVMMPCAKVYSVTPILPQSLSARPLMVDENALVEVELVQQDAVILSDGVEIGVLKAGEALDIKRFDGTCTFWHPKNRYDYLATLRNKLGWQHRADIKP